MRTRQRLLGLKAWATEELCAGRTMKAPGKGMSIADIRQQEPKCFLAWMPRRPDKTDGSEPSPLSVTPGIIIMPGLSKGKFMEEERFDRYSNVNRPDELGQTLAVSILFSVYEPGTRLPGFAESVKNGGMDMRLIAEGTEEGLFTLFDWMDDAREKLLGQRTISGTDLIVREKSLYYSLYTDQDNVMDTRPIFYGFINVEFNCHADEGANSAIDQYLT